MTIIQAIFAGIVHGLAAFLPISDTGHLAILASLFAIDVRGDNMLFSALMNLGTLLAVLIVFWGEIREMLLQLFGAVHVGPYAYQQRAHFPGARLFLLLLVSSVPMLVMIPFTRALRTLFYRPFFVGAVLILNGVGLYAGSRMKPGRLSETNMGFLDALIIGICQCVSMIPGLSRTGVVITAGLSLDQDRTFAVRYSLLLAVPVLFGRFVSDLTYALGNGVDAACMPAYLVGTAFALVFGIISLTLTKMLLSKENLDTFSYYSMLIGVLFIILTVIF